MDNEVPLPPPPRIRHRSPTKQSTSLESTSKPFYHYHQLSSRFDDPSSDPAFFSSDDIPASGLENYHNASASTGNSRKRRYKGTWWGETVVDLKRKRADFKEKRFVDSGVWLGSDEGLSVSGLPSEDVLWGEDDDDILRDGNNTRGRDSNARSNDESVVVQTRASFKGNEEPEEHQLAQAFVLECLDNGQDSIDLSNGHLQTIPPGLLRPLQHLTKVPPVTEAPVTEDVYGPLQPFLRLFLSGNALTTLSGELFELGSLKVLSLRNNKLTQIPPAVRRLTMLQELNLSVNRLQCLPWELLWLIHKGDLKHLIVRPNPLAQIEEADIAKWQYPDTADDQPDLNEADDESETEAVTATKTETLKACEYEGPAPEEAWAPIHIATGPVQRFNMEGLPVPIAPETQNQNQNQNRNTLPTRTSPVTVTRVPSLREVALLALSKSLYFDQIPDSDLASYPGLMARLLRQAREVRNMSGRCCSVCYRSFVIPRTEWIEWWDVSTYENGLKGPRCPGEKLRPLPFRRVGCSWACVPGGDMLGGKGTS